MGRKPYAGNLPFRATQDALGPRFSEPGKVESVVLITDRDTGQSRRFGFSETSNDAEPKAAIAESDGVVQDAEVGLPDPYVVVSVRSVPAPAGTTGASWHRYEISQGENRIVGYRAGDISDVTAAIDTIVQRLNERRRHRRGRVQVVLQSRSVVSKPRARG